MNPISNSIPQLDRHPDLHLDAEVLNAFTEQALAAHEREHVLAHIAVCGRCREVLFLAQELSGELVEAPVRIPLPLRAPEESRPLNAWLRTWRYAWVSMAACAAVITVVVILHLRQEQSTEKGEPIAAVRQPVRPKPAELREFAAARSSEGTLQAQTNPVNSVNQAEAFVRAPGTPGGADASPSATPAGKPEALAAAPSMEIAQREPQANEDAIELAEVNENPAKLARDAKAQPVPSIEPMSQLAGQESAMPLAKRSPALLKGFMSVGGPQHSLMAVRADIAAAHAGELYDEDVIVARNAMLNKLPSGKMPISTVSSQNHLLAVDGSGSVFLSESQGYVWEPVETQWTGRAVEVRLQPAPDLGLAAFARAVKAKRTPQPVYELVTDRWDIWVSSDGKRWERK